MSVASGLVMVLGAPPLAARQSISPLTAAQVSTFKPYTHYASTAYCKPAKTLAWSCGCEFLARLGAVTVLTCLQSKLRCEPWIPAGCVRWRWRCNAVLVCRI